MAGMRVAGGRAEDELAEIFAEQAARLRVAQLADGALLDLADALAGHFESAAHLFQRMILIIEQAKAQLDHFAFALGQIIENAVDFLAEQAAVGGLDGAGLVLVFG